MMKAILNKFVVGLGLVLSTHSAMGSNILPGPNDVVSNRSNKKTVTTKIAGISVVTPIAATELTFTVDSIVQEFDFSFYLYVGMRKKIEFYSFSDGDSGYIYYNSNLEQVSRIAMTKQEFDQIKYALKSISKTCPAKIDIDRATFRILRITKTCDDMAAVNVEDNAG